MAKKKDSKDKEPKEENVQKEEVKDETVETEENIVDEEKEQEAEGKEQDYNSIFDDDYVDEKVKSREEVDKNDGEEEEEVENSDEEIEPEESEEKPKEDDDEEDSEEDESDTEKQTKEKSKDSSKQSPKKEKDNKKEEKPKEDSEKVDDDAIHLREEKPKKARNFPTKKVLVVLLIILALLAGAFGGYLYFKNTNKPKEEPKTETKTEEPKKEETKKEVYVTADGGLNLREDANSSAKSLALIPKGTKLTVLEEKDGWYKVEYDGKTGWVSKDFVSDENPLVYTNDEYGFQLTFPEGWSNYKVVKKDVDNGDGTTSPVLYIGIKVSDANSDSTVGKGYADMFAISVLTPDEWNTAKNSEGPKPAYITENSKYVFVWSPSQAGPQEVTDERDQVNDIIKTFKLL